MQSQHAPNDPMYIKLDVKDMPKMVMLKLLHRAPSPEVPYLDNLIIACTNKASRSRVKGKGTHKRVVSNEGAYALACHRIPHLDCTVA
jgi:hypothetical protein